ncbi:MAG: tRNA glutamyl-Q(34) synthetase GluQRS [Pseudolabrys sp.]|nr:tRNA glutamyl-Q(34) synthetase GluQRS [Pseudolabrys sp.]MBV9260625.1 tRNA glutamyl-Q(34) synthetase GluQRS [Pseudolabrys sp.]
MPPVFRFAPSPNGYLHLGHAYSALLNADLAHRAGGKLLLRIEDIDETRCRSEYETAIYEDLGWLGVTWEPPIRRQSEYYADYRAALAKLEVLGLVYPAFESRAEIARFVAESEPWPRDPDGAAIYPGQSKALTETERRERIASGAPYALRLDMESAIARTGALQWAEAGIGTTEANPAAWGDVIVARRETSTSYHLAVVVDDALQGVTDVVRGRDLYESTSVHRVLQSLLGFAAPQYRHHALILDDQGEKLSKSTQATGLRELRAQGKTPVDIRRMVGLD